MDKKTVKKMLEQRMRWYPFEMDDKNATFSLGQMELLAKMLGLNPENVPLFCGVGGTTGAAIEDVDPFDVDAMERALWAVRAGVPYESSLAEEMDDFDIERFRLPTKLRLVS